MPPQRLLIIILIYKWQLKLFLRELSIQKLVLRLAASNAFERDKKQIKFSCKTLYAFVTNLKISSEEAAISRADPKESKNLSIFATMTASVTKKTKEKHQYTYLQAAKETFLPFQWKNPSKIAEFLSGHKNATLAEVNANSRILSVLMTFLNVWPISQLITHVLLQGTACVDTLGLRKKRVND